MLKAGTNSYITVQEADELLKGAAGEAQWAALQDRQKEELLTAAAGRMERLPFRGKKHSLFQEMAFPRDSRAAVPQTVKLAQAMEAAAGTPAESGKQAAASSLSSPEAYALLSPYLLENETVR